MKGTDKQKIDNYMPTDNRISGHKGEGWDMEFVDKHMKALRETCIQMTIKHGMIAHEKYLLGDIIECSYHEGMAIAHECLAVTIARYHNVT